MLNIFINTWKNYNDNGADEGQWITLPMDADELEETLENIAIKMADFDPEYAIHDYEFTCDINFEISEYENISEINDLMQAINDLDTWDQTKAAAILEAEGRGYFDIDDIDNYTLLEGIDNDYDLGYYWIEDSGCYDLGNLGNLRNYIDYEGFGRDCSYDGTYTSYGFLYR